MIVIDTHVSHSHATGEYAHRRQQCHHAATELGLTALRDATPAHLQRLRGIPLQRARHVVTENERVLAMVDQLTRGDLAAVGALLGASHASLRDDFEVSTPELNAAVDASIAGGAIGARMTGGGFGGCACGVLGLPCRIAPASRPRYSLGLRCISRRISTGILGEWN